MNKTVNFNIGINYLEETTPHYCEKTYISETSDATDNGNLLMVKRDNDYKTSRLSTPRSRKQDHTRMLNEKFRQLP